MNQNDSPDRRSVLRGAAVAGGLLWTTPVVQVLAPAASAAGTPPPGLGTGLSYVAVLLRARGVLYRVKFEADDGTVEIGGFQTPACGSFATSERATGETIQNVVQRHAFSGGSFQLVLTHGVALLDWVAKQGVCCMTKSGSTTTGYLVAESPSTNTYVFPPAPNQQPCSLRATSTATPTPLAVEPVQSATSTASATPTATTQG